MQMMHKRTECVTETMGELSPTKGQLGAKIMEQYYQTLPRAFGNLPDLCFVAVSHRTDWCFRQSGRGQRALKWDQTPKPISDTNQTSPIHSLICTLESCTRPGKVENKRQTP